VRIPTVNSAPRVPHRLVLALCWSFATLYGVWMLPDTVFIRHFCMVAGGILSLFVIYPRRYWLLKKEALPIWLIASLLIWVTLHLYFFGHDFERQLDEYTRIWKKVAVSAVFAIGLGFSLMSQAGNPSKTRRYWQIIYLGLLLPLVVYYIKFLITAYAPHFGYAVPKYLIYTPDALGNPLGISRAFYVFYCLPAFAIALAAIARSIRKKQLTFANSSVYFAVLPLTLLIFYIEGDRLGTAFGLLLIFFSVVVVFIPLALKNIMSWKAALALLLCLLISGVIIGKAVQSNAQWQTLMADAKLAVQVDRYDAWKYNRITHPGYPINEMGIPASDSNYMRIAWAIIGTKLLAQNPLGYGLLSLSFGELSREKWPDAETSWSHSAWLDFALGYGIPGLLILLLATFLVWRSSSTLPHPWSTLARWALPAACLVMITKEISSEVIVNTFIFLVTWLAACNLANAMQLGFWGTKVTQDES
jgi:hypothetical protein